MGSRNSSTPKYVAWFALAVGLSLMAVLQAGAAHSVSRPIAPGAINQVYKYGERHPPDAPQLHKGLDFSATRGTPVLAIASGTVTDVYDGVADTQGVGEGNYVLLQHNQMHYDRQSDAWVYVYSIYEHLKQGAMEVTRSQSVVAGDTIAGVDDTGTSGGDHLHLQIMLHPLGGCTLSELYEYSSRTRNPELWLTPYGENTGTVVGRLADENAGLVGGYSIYGLHKQWGTYARSLTYGEAGLNADDYLMENWGTTDVAPGTYVITTTPSSGGAVTALGTYQVVAKQTTYVGLYPIWLPYYDREWSTWSGDLFLWNQDGSDRTLAYTSIFGDYYGWPTYGDYRLSDLYPQEGKTEGMNLDGLGHGVTVPGRPSSAIVTVHRDDWPTSRSAYSGIPVSKLSNVAYSPMLLHDLTTTSGEGSSQIFVMNAGTVPVSFNIYFYDPTGANVYTRSVENLPPNGTHVDDLIYLPTEWWGAAKISAPSGSRLAVVTELQLGYWRRLSYEGFPGHATTKKWYIPLFTVRLANGLSTPVTFQNTSTSTIYPGNLQLVCTRSAGSPPPPTLTLTNTTSIPPMSTYAFNPVTNMSLPPGFYGSCYLNSTYRNGVAFVQMRYVTDGLGQDNAAAYEAIPSTGTAHVISFPRVAQVPTNGGFATAITVQNLGTTAATVNLEYFGSSDCGSSDYGPYVRTIPAGGNLILNHRLRDSDPDLPDGWCGQLLVTSNSQHIDGFAQLTDTTCPDGDTFMAHNASLHPTPNP